MNAEMRADLLKLPLSGWRAITKTVSREMCHRICKCAFVLVSRRATSGPYTLVPNYCCRDSYVLVRRLVSTLRHILVEPRYR